MSAESRQAHWEKVYTTKSENEVSWFQDSPGPSLELIDETGATAPTAIVDVGGGASRLVDSLVARGFKAITVLDISRAAIAVAGTRLGDKGRSVRWIVADVTKWEPSKTYDVWHDRAAFHFLTSAADQAAYVTRLRRALRPGGHAIIGTFALDGPERCSGLPVARHDAATLGKLLGVDFVIVDTRQHDHQTPGGARQRFQFSTFRLA
jgi:2-polyprenyl-3-methyl-5-hydroxy-6-metoxy-1,4-benzoquinol methylase